MRAHTQDHSLRLVSAVLDESQHPLLLVDRSGRVLYANALACEKLGLLGAWGSAASLIEHEILGPKLDEILLGLERGDTHVEFDFQHAGSAVHASARWLPTSDWLLIRLIVAGAGGEIGIETRSPANQEARWRAAASPVLPRAAAAVQNEGEDGDTICESLGDGLYFLACTPEMKKIRKQTFLIASANVPVLISGESGSGKEVIARMIHNHRREGNVPFVKVNCAALPTELLESELFGYEQGAFTGAVRAKPGKFELANHGTIFLDEIAEMSTHLQSKLLHVLQDGRFSRLGSRHMVQVRVRVIAATNVDVQEAIRQGRFREDLYYRLNVVPCHLPPLRERVAEIPILFRLFFERYCREFGRNLPEPGPALMEAAEMYPWPGNVRELENYVKRYVILDDEEDSLQELLEMRASRGGFRETHTNGNAHANGNGHADGNGHGNGNDYANGNGHTNGNGHANGNGNGYKAQTLKSLVRGLKDEAEMQAIADVLRQTNWRRKEAAHILGISYKALLYKMRQFGFSPSKSNGHYTQEKVI